MPEPEPTLATQVEAHLVDCAPCRGEFEALKEVDRRLVQLSESVAAQATATFRQRQRQPPPARELYSVDLDKPSGHAESDAGSFAAESADALALAGTLPQRRPGVAPRIWVAALVVMVLAVALAWAYVGLPKYLHR